MWVSVKSATGAGMTEQIFSTETENSVCGLAELLPGNSHSLALRVSHWQRMSSPDYSAHIFWKWNGFIRNLKRVTKSFEYCVTKCSLSSAGGDWPTRFPPKAHHSHMCSPLKFFSTTSSYPQVNLTRPDCCWYQLPYTLAAFDSSCTCQTTVCTTKNTKETN